MDKAGAVHAVLWVRTVPGPAATPAPGPPDRLPAVDGPRQDLVGAGRRRSGNVSAGHPPLLAADPKSSDIYAVWNANAEVQNTVQGFSGDLDAFVRVSHAGGQTWSDRVTISDETVKANQFEPGIAIAPNGQVHVAWYDFKNSPANMLVTTGHSGDTGISDVYYVTSRDHGSTWAKPLRVNDRGIDRSKGVWSNNIDSKFNVGVAATNDDVFFAWQDTRNAIDETGSEDIYTSSLPLDPIKVADSGSGIPGWTLVLTGVFGLDAGVALTVAMMRRRPDDPAAAGSPARVPVSRP